MNTSSITERDKKLLYGLGLIVIVALFYIIGIRPLNNKIVKLEDKIDSAQVEYDTMKMKTYQLGLLKDFEESALNLNTELSGRYYEMMVPAEIDRLYTGKALGYGLKANNLTIQSSKEKAVLLPYNHSKAWSDYQAYYADGEEASAASKKEDDSEGLSQEENLDAIASLNDQLGMYYASDTSYADVYATRVTLDVYGNRDKAQELLDEIIDDPATRVTNFEWTSLTGIPLQYVDGELVSYEVENPGRLIVRFDFYMYDGTSFDKFMAEDEEETENAEDSESTEE